MFRLGDRGADFSTVGELVRHYQATDMLVEGSADFRLRG